MSEEGVDLQYEKMQLENILVNIRDQELGIRTYITNANNAIRAMTAIKNGESSSSIVPLGAGVMAKAGIQSDSTVLIAVGKGVIIEMDMETATNHLETQLSEKNAVLGKTVSDQRTIMSRLEIINTYLAKVGEPKEPPPGN